jgi:hypothetical protein
VRDSVRTDADTRTPRTRAKAALVVGALGVFRLPRERTVIMGSLLLV